MQAAAVKMCVACIFLSEGKMFAKSLNKLVIDADGCPVVREAAKIAAEYSVQCMIVCDSSHYFNISTAETIVVSQRADAADFYIVNHIGEGDVIVTQDYGLAAMCLAKKACAINQDGKIYSDENISGLLESRAVGKKVMRAGGRLKGPPKRNKEQNDRFIKTIRRIFENGTV